jgi:hypothetical protein
MPINASMVRLLASLALLTMAAALTASPALARDHDKLPDRWERKHHLNVKKNDARRDRDHDGLNNLREYRAHTNPRKKDSDRDGLKDGAERRFGFNPRDRDSDNDGVKDGRENAGKVTKLSSSSITIRLAAGGKLTAGLGMSSDCTPAADAPGDSGDSGDSADDPSEDTGEVPSEDADDPATDDGPGADASQDDPADSDAFDDDAFDRQLADDFAEGEDCGTSRLKQGALVHEATVDRSGPGPVVVAVKLVRS